MDRPKYDIKARKPQLVTALDGSALTIRLEVLVNTPRGQQGTGKYIHLSVTPTDGMHLLAQLKQAQAQHDWADVPAAESTMVPPQSEKH